ncbi:putative ATP-dependent RNA helicase [uncultured archaeon]|nr:putative ATP-dependent RNA helicase [uncultured archaeon]
MPFSHFNLPTPIVKAIQDQGYTHPTAIQEKAIPLILSGKDIIGHSETGSGKTAAFGLPMLNMLSKCKGVNALILTPTRELCVQVSEALAGFAKYLPVKVVPVFGGVGIGQQINASRTADVIVATPGRLLDLMARGLNLGAVRYLVLDEADRMLDMGFIKDVEKILSHTPKQRQTLLFSATSSPRLRSLVNRYMNSPVSVQAKTHVDPSLLIERAYMVQIQEKFSLLVHCLKHETSGIALIFCKTRRNCDKLAKSLRAQKISATEIHGGLSQSKRIQTITNLHKRGIGILVATDVASRGLHIDNISHVYNYDLPQTPDDYVHRIGRTARAGAKGNAVTFVTPQDARDFKLIMRDIERVIKPAPLPTFEKIAMPSPTQEPSSPSRDGHRKHKQFWNRRRH